MTESKKKFAAIEAYKALKKKAVRNENTVMHNFRKAQIAGEATTYDNQKLVDLENLKELDGRQKYENAFVASGADSGKEYLEVHPLAQYDEFQESAAMNAVLGFGRTELHEILEQNKENTTEEALSKGLRRPMGDKIKKIQATPLAKLGPESLDEILEYTETEGRVDRGKLSEHKEYMAELIELYDKIGAVTDKMLEEAPYKLDN
ncbi:hypothetical protein KY348_07290 [Candidatus Woesearchaeota archaeon]|nr:hypothetical protein [Candidatus Woesearchaeota archaeon]